MLDGKQAGDPEKVAALIIEASTTAEPPLHLFAGKISNTLADEKMQAVKMDLDAWLAASEATDFED